MSQGRCGQGDRAAAGPVNHHDGGTVLQGHPPTLQRISPQEGIHSNTVSTYLK